MYCHYLMAVLGHADGLCSIYVHEDANLATAIPVIVDAKTDYPAACNSVETVLVHAKVAPTLLPQLAFALLEKNVEIRADVPSMAFLPSNTRIRPAVDLDFDTEFCDLILAVKIVDSLHEAIEQINKHGSRHTDAIMTESERDAHESMRRVDSAGVYWNASTRFADGYRYVCCCKDCLSIKIWIWCRNWREHKQDACAWSSGLGRIDDLQVSAFRTRTDGLPVRPRQAFILA
jgi:glutamate-5-semialdehyde dehydrogenase